MLAKNNDSGNPTESQGQMPVSITRIIAKLADPAVQTSLKGLNRTVQLSLTDLKEDYLLTIADGKLSKVERKTFPDANIAITVASSLLESIMNRATNPITAYMMGMIRFKGSEEDLTYLQKMF